MSSVIEGPNSEFALRIIDQRRKRGWTQEELGKLVGVDKRSISMYENGHTFPREETIRKLADTFEVDPYELVSGSTKDTDNYITNQYTQFAGSKTDLQLELVYIEDWYGLERCINSMNTPTYSNSPRYDNESSDLTKFIPVIKPRMMPFRATRYPGALPFNALYPPNSIVVFDPTPNTLDNIPTGSDVIFRRRGLENPTGLRKLIKEPGAENALLTFTNSSYDVQPIVASEINIEIIGLITSVVSFRP